MLYKYLSKSSANVVENLTIRFSPLRSLNDPFESRPLFDLSERLTKVTEDAIKEFYLEPVFDDRGNAVSLKEFEDHLKKSRAEMQGQLGLSGAGNELVDTIGDRFGVFCVSRTKTSLLMWSHYASEGAGFVLALDSKHEFFHQRSPDGLEAKPIPVRYSTERPVTKPEDEDFYEKLFCNKPLEWCYEEEERIFRNYSTEVPAQEKLDSYGREVKLSQLPSDAITGIYLGYNSKQDLVEQIIQAVQKNNLKCPLYKGFISESEYKVEFEQIET